MKVNGSPIELLQPEIRARRGDLLPIDIRARIKGVCHPPGDRQAVVVYYAKYFDAVSVFEKKLVSYDRTLLIADPVGWNLSDLVNRCAWAQTNEVRMLILYSIHTYIYCIHT